MITRIKYFLIGSPLPNEMGETKKLNKIRALAAFSPDALSSVAYANQEIFLGLVVAGATGLSYQFPIAIGITLLLLIVAVSYMQTISAYPNGGGSYIVARENLGTMPGLIAGAALSLDYVLTAAVSLTAGIAAISSAFPALWPHKVWIALVLLALITLLNMRGLQESGSTLSFPVYLFIFSFLAMILFGIFKAIHQGEPTPIAAQAPAAIAPLGFLLVMHAFSAGCTALTGIEAISNGVPTFRSPECKNARQTLFTMAILMALMFVGSIGLTQFFGVTANNNETILSALAHQLLGNGFFYYVVQISTLLILAVAANTSFAGFPRVAAIMAKDKYLPRQLFNLGDRLVFQNGILLLALMAAVLILLFNGDSHALVPLFAVGAFTAFSLSQFGMIIHWIRSKEKNWLIKALVNAIGAIITFCTLIVISISKFTEGAWISLIVIPALVYAFLKIHKHYSNVSKQLKMSGLPPSLRPWPEQRVVIPISGVHRGIVDAVNFARAISDHVTAVNIDVDPGPDEVALKNQWNQWFPDVNFVVIASPFRSLVEPLLTYLDKTDAEHNDGQHAILVLPEIIPASSWQEILHNQSAEEIKKALLYKRHQHGLQRIIIDVPYHLNK